jgi:hypothetical protein
MQGAKTMVADGSAGISGAANFLILILGRPVIKIMFNKKINYMDLRVY